MLRILADSMAYIRFRRPERCLVRFNGPRLRLFAGRLIVMTLEDRRIWLSVTRSPQSSALDALRSWCWDRDSYPEYKRVLSRNGYYSPLDDDGGDWKVIRRFHLAYLDDVLARGPAADRRTVLHHEADIAALVARMASADGSGWVQEDEVFHPDDLLAHPSTTRQVADDLYAGAHAREGRRRLRQHLERERDWALAMLKREAARGSDGLLRCDACGFATQDVFPGLDGDVCEVHHRQPLADGSENVVTRLGDLAVLCPSCHRAIHRTDPMLTVEAFRARIFPERANEAELPIPVDEDEPSALLPLGRVADPEDGLR